MSFFLPSRLISLEYLTGEPDTEYENIARSYIDDIDLAFFVVEFGYTPSDYEQLTNRQIAFIKKAWENKQVRETSLINMAINNSISNSRRKKGQGPIPLWKKQEKIDIAKTKDDIKIIEKMAKKSGNKWVEKLWAAKNRH